MQPQLGEINLDGPSRHKLQKGLILISLDGKRIPNHNEQLRIVDLTNQEMMKQSSLIGFKVTSDSEQPSLVTLATPFLTVHNRDSRDQFFQKLSLGINIATNVSASMGYFPIGVGANPLILPSEGYHPALCADIHEIEVFDDLEINRIYNLFRQYLPELIALSSNSALYGGKLQKDLCTRMRLNPSSFTPPALAVFSSKQIERLKRDVRKRYGVGDLTQLDVNILGQNSISLRFSDAQFSLRFIRAQLLLFQAIAIHGRSLARQGSQMPTLHSRILSENKALAIESGPSAMFKPDLKRDIRRATEWYQDQRKIERASTALLQSLEVKTVEDSGTILYGLKALRADYDELSPWLLGAELRKRGQACLISYGEYQTRLYYVARNGWPAQLLADQKRIYQQPAIDLVLECNQQKYGDLSMQIQTEWNNKLARRQNSTLTSSQTRT